MLLIIGKQENKYSVELSKNKRRAAAKHILAEAAHKTHHKLTEKS
jgi:ribosomal protein L4